MDAKPFAHELALLGEVPQREAKLVERLRELPAEASVELLHGLVELAATGDPEGRVVLQVCAGLFRFEDELGYEVMAELFVAADEREYDDVKQLLSRTEVKKKPPKDRVENDHLERTLGERTALARSTRDRDLLDRLLHDRNPKVIRNLLLNARIVERDVVTIAASRPSVPEVLHEVLSSAKWGPRYDVKKALAQNPYLPVGQAVSLLPALTAQDLEDVAVMTDLAETVRDTAREILARRRPGNEAN